MDRKYSVREIDDLRLAVEKRLTYGSLNIERLAEKKKESLARLVKDGFLSESQAGCLGSIGGKCPCPEEVEGLVRTYMLGGVAAKDLYEQDGVTFYLTEEK